MMRLAGKIVIVTGSATGIGRAIATRCVTEGARVVVHGLEPDLVREVVASLGADAAGPRAVGHVEDLTAAGCPERLVRLAVDSFGRLDNLVNNAAIITTGTRTAATTSRSWSSGLGIRRPAAAMPRRSS